jgi:hypothetical protein
MARKRPTPSDIEVRNYKKRTGLFEVWFTDGCKFIGIQSRRKENAQSMMFFDQLKRCGFTIERSTGRNGKEGPFIAWLAVKGNPEAIAAALKLVAEPERCARCNGSGKISNPIPAPSLPATPNWMDGESREAFDLRHKKAADEYCAKHGVADTSWSSIVKCPVCRGCGRAAVVEEEAEA